ncbi:hypothetical protein D822_09555, partial [Streptococcus ratti FA-1 = DSM 20564]|uniref:hypothetical protein n=1 Tax=Streptococcus ratti TaxID=1341 RepID=UPI0002C01BBC
TAINFSYDSLEALLAKKEIITGYKKNLSALYFFLSVFCRFSKDFFVIMSEKFQEEGDYYEFSTMSLC